MRKLEAWSGKRRGVCGGDRERMKGEGGWMEGEEVRREWKRTFEKVGEGLREKEGFEDEWKEEVEEKLEEWKNEAGVGWQGADEEIKGEGGEGVR